MLSDALKSGMDKVSFYPDKRISVSDLQLSM